MMAVAESPLAPLGVVIHQSQSLQRATSCSYSWLSLYYLSLSLCPVLPWIPDTLNLYWHTAGRKIESQGNEREKEEDRDFVTRLWRWLIQSTIAFLTFSSIYRRAMSWVQKWFLISLQWVKHSLVAASTWERWLYTTWFTRDVELYS